MINNTFLSNDLQENNITAYDSASSRWDADAKAEGLQGLMQQVTGEQGRGNHYSDYDEPAEGCNDTDKDGFCDLPRKIEGGSAQDNHSSALPMNR